MTQPFSFQHLTVLRARSLGQINPPRAHDDDDFTLATSHLTATQSPFLHGCLAKIIHHDRTVVTISPWALIKINLFGTENTITQTQQWRTIYMSVNVNVAATYKDQACKKKKKKGKNARSPQLGDKRKK